MKPDKKILIVEDEWFIALDIQNKAEKLGYTVCGVVPGGEDAIEKVKTDPPDLVLMDIMLKGKMDGVEAAQQIAANHGIPVVYVTAYASKELMERVRMTAPYGYIVKPFKEAELHTAIEIAFYKREMEAKLLQARKLESIGILAGGFAHDFNNILYPILGYAEMVKEELPPDSPLQKYIEGIIRGTLRAGRLVKQILVISRHVTKELKPVQVQPILREAVKLSGTVRPASVEIKQEIDAHCGMIMADPTQLQLVIMNIISNAFHAMEENGGILTLSLGKIDLTDGTLPDSELPAGHYVCLTVSDTGMGMDKETRERIFDPYFTTKDVGKGSGLGLSLAYAIVRTCKGEIVCDSEPGRGTTFTLYLPHIVSEVADKIEADIVCKDGNPIDTKRRLIQKENAYTLLEIIVVITLLGLMAGLTIPRMSNLYSSFQWANERDDVLRRIGMLGFSAFQEGQEFELKSYPASDSTLPLELPEGWRIKADPPIRYKSNGICLGGTLQLTCGKTAMLLNLAPPHCRPALP